MIGKAFAIGAVILIAFSYLAHYTAHAIERQHKKSRVVAQWLCVLAMMVQIIGEIV